MNRIEIKNEEKSHSLIITVPYELLKHVANNHPSVNISIVNDLEFFKAVAFEIENNLGEPESGLTGLQELIDEAIVEVAESGNDCLVFTR